MDDFEAELKSGFLEEVTQLLVDAEQCFLELEANPQEMATLEKLFRIAHNIKGSSKAVGFDSLGAFTHEFESFMLKCKSGQIPILPQTISLLLKCNDHVKLWIDSLKADQSATLDNAPLIAEIHGFSISTDEALVAEQPPEASSSAQEEAISSDEVGLLAAAEAALNQSDIQIVDAPMPADILAAVAAEKEVERKQPPTASAGAKNATEESIRVSISRLEKLLNFVGEMVILQTVLKEQAYAANPLELRRTIHQIGKVTKEVQEISMSLRMVPLKQTFQKMQRIVRDTSSSLGKKVQLILEGEETEVDKTILEALSDPLVHLIRNAVDHGIESVADRIAKGKPEQGQVNLRAYHQSGKLVIEITDNGGGIPADRLRQKAIEKGILKPDQKMSDQDAINLIFHSGFSTKAQVTEVSGRGVGMDVVKTNIEAIQGEVLVETKINEGSTFKIILPLTLAIIDGMVIRCGDERYVIPLSHVHETLKPESKDVRFASGLGEVLLLRGENLPVVRLAQRLGKQKVQKAPSEQIAIIVRALGKPFATLVDDVIGQHQVVIKKLGAEMQHLRGYSGSAILGDGKPALILELGDLVATFPGNAVQIKKQVAA